MNAVQPVAVSPATVRAARLTIDKARWWALTHQPFYGSLASNLADVIDPSIPTAATDGKKILWNPTKVGEWTEEEVRFVVLHETLHCAHDHFSRLPLNDQGNQAGDYAINAILRNIPGIKMPEGGLLDSRFDNLAEEEILAALRKEPEEPEGEEPGDQPGEEPGDQPGKGKRKGEDPGGCGGFIEPAPDKPNGPTLKEDWERNILQAEFVRNSTGQGDCPADMRRILDRITAVSEVDWKQETCDFVKTVVSARSDWSRSTRRMATAPVIYPRRRTDSLGTIVFVRDSSGSVSDKTMAEFTGLIAGAAADTGCEALVLDADAAVQAEYRLSQGELPPLEPVGGGGTDFRPAFARVQELIEEGEKIAGLVYLTDLYGTEPDAGTVDIPTLWLCINEQVGGFGRTVRIKDGL